MNFNKEDVASGKAVSVSEIKLDLNKLCKFGTKKIGGSNLEHARFAICESIASDGPLPVGQATTSSSGKHGGCNFP